MKPGEIFPASGEIVLNKDRAAISLTVANTGDRPIHVGSHYHFAETNASLEFDREASFLKSQIGPGTSQASTADGNDSLACVVRLTAPDGYSAGTVIRGGGVLMSDCCSVSLERYRAILDVALRDRLPPAVMTQVQIPRSPETPPPVPPLRITLDDHPLPHTGRPR